MDQENSPFFKKIQPVGQTSITPQTKQIILNVFFQLSTLNPEKTFRDLADETGMLTGVSGRTVSRLKAEENAFLALTNRVREEESSANDNDDENRSQASSSQNPQPSGSRKSKCTISSSLKKKFNIKLFKQRYVIKRNNKLSPSQRAARMALKIAKRHSSNSSK